ncbi:MAG TPA: heparinase II/III family protein [Hypericibacter adhaerens]|uniref:heparinase II/III family protein n=1 Tax=Hypericibacter adhaerens TaxID=2602016 RepID=UPI002CD2ECAA|nr:heparinase II/III family protein [Hypericibacter adhaerens]HWA44759.1 heparinase II/III family protein [Hypericibacter adhaerens]
MAPGIDPFRRALRSPPVAAAPRNLASALHRALRLCAMPEGWLAGQLRYAILSRLPIPGPRGSDGAGAERLAAAGPGLWPGMPERGAALLAGEIELLGRKLPLPEPFWSFRPEGDRLMAELHGFAWLADLVAAGNAGIVRARELIDQWLTLPESRSRDLRHPAIAGRRLAAWLQSANRLLVGGDAGFDERLHRAVAEDATRLARLLPGGLCGGALIEATKGLLLASLVLPQGRRWEGPAMARLAAELDRQILPDGGQVERNPSRQLRVIRDLAEIEIAFARAGRPTTPALGAALRSLAPLIRLLQHGDSGLALFNGANEETAGLIETVLTAAGETPQAMTKAPHAGFQRLAAGRMVALVEAGRPAPPGFDGGAHAGTFAIEVSIGTERLITGCGAHAADADWAEALRATAAHSTLSIAHSDSSPLLPGDGLASRPGFVSCKREEEAGTLWLELSHDGYGPRFGLRHRRRLYMTAGGEELRGEDRVEPLNDSREERTEALPVTIRFHLHPDVQASLAQNGHTVLLRLASGAGWRLRIDGEGAAVALAESVYAGRRGRLRRSQQVVVETGYRGPESWVRWALTRELRKAEPLGRPDEDPPADLG